MLRYDIHDHENSIITRLFKMNDNRLILVDGVQDLGVYFDKKLKFIQHIVETGKMGLKNWRFILFVQF